MDDDTRKVLAEIVALLEGAPSPEHDRLQAFARRIGRPHGISATISSLPDGARPDVLRWHNGAKRLFIGDAKVSANERPTTRTRTARARFHPRLELPLYRSAPRSDVWLSTVAHSVTITELERDDQGIIILWARLQGPNGSLDLQLALDTGAAMTLVLPEANRLTERPKSSLSWREMALPQRRPGSIRS